MALFSKTRHRTPFCSLRYHIARENLHRWDSRDNHRKGLGFGKDLISQFPTGARYLMLNVHIHVQNSGDTEPCDSYGNHTPEHNGEEHGGTHGAGGGTKLLVVTAKTRLEGQYIVLIPHRIVQRELAMSLEFVHQNRGMKKESRGANKKINMYFRRFNS